MSSGKVKCTCGWSWNKSDSSKKDMYICHECGRDNSNNMKNGGWLDNYGEEDNYNNSEVSLPEGFVGEGIFNGPKFDSPAWGGQFQMGGSVYPVNYVPEAQTGGSFPGATGFSYARTGSIPSKGPRRNQTDVTDASAQNGKEMQYYQQGLDWQPKTISRDGSQLDKAQTGENVKFDPKKFAADKKRNTPLQKSVDKEAQSEDTRRWVDTKEYKDQVKANKIANDKAILADRKDRMNKSVVAQKKSFTKDNWRQQLADETQATGDKFRMFPEDPDSFIDEWMNPGVMIGNMASDLGSAPLRAQQEDSYMPYVTSIGVPLLTGGLEGLGAKTTKQFVSNLANPFNIVPGYKSVEKSIGKALGTESGLLSNAYKLNPWAFKANPEAYYRGIGRGGFEDALKSGVIREKPGGGYNETYFTDKFNSTNQYSKDKGYGVGDPFADDDSWHFVKPDDARSYVAEIPKNNIRNVVPNSLDNPHGYYSTTEPILTDNAKFYRQHWLKGYKEIPKQEDGGIIKDDRGQWEHPGEITEIGSNQITMQGVPYPVLGVSDTGDTKLMKPGKNYKFKGKKVTEYPMAKNGMRQEQKGLQNLDNLLNFTNYNKPQPGGWLNKYN